MSVIRRGEKELRLDAFLARGLAGMAAAAPPGGQGAIAVIARSVLSPVVRTVAAHAGEIAAAGGAARLILARPDGLAASDALAAMAAAGLACEVRLARNPRLIEAHEQLTIDRRVAWTGDTMRRDPAISDAYESFVEDCPGLAASAAATFERLWGDCAPFAEVAPPAARAREATGTAAQTRAARRDPCDR
jgi:hypothetical protein